MKASNPDKWNSHCLCVSAGKGDNGRRSQGRCPSFLLPILTRFFLPGDSERSDDQNNHPSLSISQRNGCRPWEILFVQTDSHREGSFHNAHASAPLGFCNTQSTWSEQRERCSSTHSVSGIGEVSHSSNVRSDFPECSSRGHLMAG